MLNKTFTDRLNERILDLQRKRLIQKIGKFNFLDQSQEEFFNLISMYYPETLQEESDKVFNILLSRTLIAEDLVNLSNNESHYISFADLIRQNNDISLNL
jgi:hypothetical protein